MGSVTLFYELIDHVKYGQCAIASRDITKGQIVIDELPYLVIDYTKDASADSVPVEVLYKRKRGFMTLSTPAKVSLILAQCPAQAKYLTSKCYIPDSTRISVRGSIAYKAAVKGVAELRRRQKLFEEIADLSDELLIDYSLMVSANAHAFDQDSVAMLEAGCKVTHTCLNPNVAVSIRPLRDTVNLHVREPQVTAKHIALRDIAKGEILFGSYAKLTNMTIPERRKYLLNHKMFACRCTHCTGKDLTRGLICENCLGDSPRSREIAPASTLYPLDLNDKNTAWKCSGCNAQSTSHEALSKLSSDSMSVEIKLRKSLTELDECQMSVDDRLSQALSLYDTTTKLFGWRHTLTASSALSVLDAASAVIDTSNTPEATAISLCLDLFTDLPELLEKWYLHLSIPPMDELANLFLLISDQLMTLTVLHHEIIPRAMSIVQELLLKVRPEIEERRQWPIGHVMEEYFDELLVTLDDLVNGPPIESHGQNEETEEN